MCVSVVPAIWLNITSARWLVVPVPFEPKFRPPRVFLASATNSFTLRAGTDGCTVTTSGADATCVIGMKSRRRS
jgi:hypothetical protein